MTKQEEDFYPEISKKFCKFLLSEFNDETEIAYSYNKYLPILIQDIERLLNGVTDFHKGYVPPLKLDILIGIKKKGEDHIALVLIEGKYSGNLTLNHYSQLIGYLQVARKIKTGILFLNNKSPETSGMSNELTDMVRSNMLATKWCIQTTNSSGAHETFEFETGLCTYFPANGIHWISSGFEDFKQLADSIKTTL